MPFSPVLPFGGLQGWQFLERTLPRQLEAFSKSSSFLREKQYFSENIGKVETASQLVDDQRLLRVSLTAFGLEDDLQNKFLVRRVLEDGTVDPDALSNRFSDKRYLEFSKAFGFGALEFTRVQQPDFGAEVLSSFERKSFEASVGNQNPTLRLAMSLGRDVSEILERTSTNTSGWLSVLGNPPLKEVFEMALRVPAGGGQVSLDNQVEFLSSQLKKITGASEFSDLADADVLNSVRQNYLLMAQISENSGRSGGSVALQLLQAGARIRF